MWKVVYSKDKNKISRKKVCLVLLQMYVFVYTCVCMCMFLYVCVCLCWKGQFLKLQLSLFMGDGIMGILILFFCYDKYDEYILLFRIFVM